MTPAAVAAVTATVPLIIVLLIGVYCDHRRETKADNTANTRMSPNAILAFIGRRFCLYHP